MRVAHGLLGTEVSGKLLTREAVVAGKETVAIVHTEGQVTQLPRVGEKVSAHPHRRQLLHPTFLASLVLEPHLNEAKIGRLVSNWLGAMRNWRLRVMSNWLCIGLIHC